MNNDTKKRLIALGAGLVILAGIAFGISNRDLLTGDVTVPLSGSYELNTNLDYASSVSTYDDATNSYYAGLALTYASQAQEFVEQAWTCADSLDAYYNYGITLDCSDTDDGEDYYEYGEVTGTSWYDGSEWDPVEDFCIDEDQLVEYWCIDNAASVFDGYAFGEVVDCGSGYSCSNGACVADEGTCSDDDDCDFGYTCSDELTCEAVEPSTCKDSDGGGEADEQATVSGTSFEDYQEVNNKKEYCIDDDTLMEFWCPESGTYEGFLYFEEYECPDNYACQDGECINILTDEDYECEEPFTDTDDEMVCRAYQAEIVQGKSRTKYDPYAGITRAEVIKIIILTMGEDELNRDQGILDMDDSHWAWGYVNRAKDLGIITETTFNPDVEVTRGTTMVWLVRAADQTWDRDEWEDLIPWSDMTASNPVTYAAMIGYYTEVDFFGDEMPVTEGYSDGTWRPENSILRYEALYLAYRSYLAWFEDEGTFVDPDEEL